MSFIKVDPAKVQAQQNAARIAELKQLLAETDYVALSDYDKDKPEVLAQRQAWREELRNIPQQASFPHSVTWPVKPE